MAYYLYLGDCLIQLLIPYLPDSKFIAQSQLIYHLMIQECYEQQTIIYIIIQLILWKKKVNLSQGFKRTLTKDFWMSIQNI
ncbi:hypothetical protein FGO68_gene16285 [Halteria grandinella]|uniref:Uncharacterized protein n=1 Tax=Halteria grandinella TaxID=5974 RepID=A0A8J8NG98_HALGN|nr:hypothetical protein FGO68_gene16285 [Halteria grandinella]